MREAKGYVDVSYLKAAEAMLKQVKQHTYELMRVEAGQHVLDVGCGPGTDTLPLAELVGPTGSVVGVDYDADMVAEADRRAAEAGVAARVHHYWADASTLPFATGEFDSCRSDRLLEHLCEPAKAVDEMGRVTKSGGTVVVFDVDWGTVSIDCDCVDIERRLMRFRADNWCHNGYSGRQLYRLFKERGLVDIAIDLHPAYFVSYPIARRILMLDAVERAAARDGVVTGDELDLWHDALERAAAAGIFFMSFHSMLVTGRRV